MLKGKKGVTLTELLAAIAIMGIIMAPVSLLFYTGYKNFFVENDTSISQNEARDTLNAIINDLRKNDKETIRVDNEHQLTVNPGVVYVYDQESGQLKRNDTLAISNITNFSVKESTTRYDTGVISISMTVKVGNGREVTLESSYRRKIMPTPTPTPGI